MQLIVLVIPCLKAFISQVSTENCIYYQISLLMVYYLQSTLIDLVFLIAPLIDIRLFKFLCFLLVIPGVFSNNDLVDKVFIKCSSKY